MNKNIAIIILLTLLGCSGQKHREIMLNKTVKVFSNDYHEQAENYTFKWKAPIGPNNKKILFNLKDDMLIFTPKTIGFYEVNLSIEDIAEEVVTKEIFYFKAIPETTEVSIFEPVKETPPTTASSKSKKQTKMQTAEKYQPQSNKKQKKRQLSKRNKPPKSSIATKNTEYAIQISAWPSLEEARIHQLVLIDEGFDAYTQRFYWKKKDEVWYRVRVGNFSIRAKALVVKEQIEEFSGITTWLDIVLIK